MVKKVYLVENLDCANCAAKIERALSKLSNVEKVNINFMTGKMESMLDISNSCAILRTRKADFPLGRRLA